MGQPHGLDGFAYNVSVNVTQVSGNSCMGMTSEGGGFVDGESSGAYADSGGKYHGDEASKPTRAYAAYFATVYGHVSVQGCLDACKGAQQRGLAAAITSHHYGEVCRRYREGDIGDYGDASMSVYVSGRESVGGESGVPMPGLFGTRIRISGACGCVLSVS